MLHPVKSSKGNFAPFVLSFAVIGRRTFPILNSIRLQFACLALLTDDSEVRKANEKLSEDTIKHRQEVTKQERKMEMAYMRQLVNNTKH